MKVKTFPFILPTADTAFLKKTILESSLFLKPQLTPAPAGVQLEPEQRQRAACPWQSHDAYVYAWLLPVRPGGHRT